MEKLLDTKKGITAEELKQQAHELKLKIDNDLAASIAEIEERAIREEIVKSQITSIDELVIDEEKEIAIDLLLPFIIKNIGLANPSLVKRLINKIEAEPTKKERAVKKMKYQTMKISRLEEEAPTFYKYLVEKAKCEPLKAEPTLLVVYRKRYDDAANIAAQADKFDSAKIALDEFGEREAIILPDSEVNPVDLKLSDFEML